RPCLSGAPCVPRCDPGSPARSARAERGSRATGLPLSTFGAPGASGAGAGEKGMRVAITGSSGLIGSALVERLRADGHQVTRLVRGRERAVGAGAVHWDPARGEVDAAGLEGHDVVIHLAGESIVGLWTARKKARIRDSRVRGTRLLAEALAALSRPPAVLLSASAIGFYGARPPDVGLDEDAPPGTGFLADTARA